MKPDRLAFPILIALSLASATSVLAQRRTTDGGGSSGRSTPSSGGGRSASSGGGSRSSGGSSGGTSRGSSGSTRREPSASSGSGTRDGGSAQPSSGSPSTRPSEGKISSVRRSARAAARRSGGGTVIIERGVYLGGCWDCNYWGWYHGGYGWYHGGWWYPEERPRYREDDGEPDAGQGYLPYPYAEYDGTGTTFVQRRTAERPGFGAVTGQFFSDVGSTTMAGRFSIEGAYRRLRAEAEYGYYAEPLQTRTDHLHTYRIGVAIQPRLGDRAYLIAGVAGRGVVLNGGDEAGGPEGELGIQMFPRRPLGLAVTGRLAALTWTGTGSGSFTLREVNTTGSLFIGRIELQAGWHFMKLGDDPAFAGPVVGTRVWF